MLTNTPSHPVFLDAVKRLSDVQTYGASVTLLQQLTPPETLWLSLIRLHTQI